MESHRLRREIIVTQVVNNVVNNAGVTFHHRVANETGASNEDLVRAHVVAQRVFDLHAVWSAIDELDSMVDASVQTAMRLEGRTITERTARWLVINRRPPIGIQSNVEHLHDGVVAVTAALPEVLVGRERTLYAERRDRLTLAGVPVELATARRRAPARRTRHSASSSRRTGATWTRSRWRTSTSGSASGCSSASCSSGSSPSRARTAGRRWCAPRCATSCTPRMRRSPRRCST